VRALANLVHGSVPPHGAFLWLRAGKAGSCFPYRPDTGWRDLLLRGGNLPAMFAVRAAWLGSARTFVGLSSPEARIAGLAALAARASGRRLLHTGEVGGTYQGTQLMLWEDAQQRALGFLDLCDALPRGGVFFGEVGLANWRLVQLRRGHRKWQRGEEGQRHARLVASDGAANHEVTDV
jgi:hypothetical protein